MDKYHAARCMIKALMHARKVGKILDLMIGVLKMWGKWKEQGRLIKGVDKAS